MPADRLTIDQCRVGMRVRCVDARESYHLVAGQDYVISGLYQCRLVLVDGHPMAWDPGRFVHTLPEMTPELRDALREWHDKRAGWLSRCHRASWQLDVLALFDAIEATPGLLDPPRPVPTCTDREPTLNWECLLP